MTYKLYQPQSQSNRKPTIVLLHGFISSRRYWKPLIPYLTAAGYRVMTIDLIGFGSARRTRSQAYDYTAHAQHIDSCLAKAGVSKPFILVGHSMGALIAAYYAAAQPTSVKKLCLLQPPIYLEPDQATANLLASGPLYRFLLRSRYRSLGWGLLKLLPNNIQKHSGAGREQSLNQVILHADNFAMLTNPPIETLLVVGDRDRAVYRENLASADLSKNIHLMIINADHHAPRKQTEHVSELLLDFIAT